MGTEWDDRERSECARRLALSMRMSTEDAGDVSGRTMQRLHEVGELNASRAFVLTVARNVAIDKLRELSRAKRRDGGSVDELPLAGAERPADEVSYAREVFVRVEAKLHEMPASPREVITRHYIDGMTLVEIVAWRRGESPRADGESDDAHHARCADWVHMNHTRGLRWLRERIAQ